MKRFVATLLLSTCTTTYEIKNVGSTTVDVPEEAKKAIGT